MRVHDLVRPPRWVLLLLAVLLVPAAALGWLSWRLLEQDGALAAQRLQERLEHAADLTVAAADRYLADLEARLPALAASTAPAPDGSVVIVERNGSTETLPRGRLLWEPRLATYEAASPSIWLPGEVLEFQREDYLAAGAAYRRLTNSRDPAVRAEALVRIARTLRKAGRTSEARAVYSALDRVGDVMVAGTPADLLARHAAAAMLADNVSAATELRAEASALLADLDAGRWRLDRPTYLFYRDAARTWSGTDAPLPASSSLSAAAALAWQQIAGATSAAARGRFTVDAAPDRFMVVWRRTADGFLAFVGPIRASDRPWSAAAHPHLVHLDDGQVTARGHSQPEPNAVRRAADTGLPWTFHVVSADPAADLAALSIQRQLLLTGLVLIATLVIAGVYVAVRAVGRELRVARLQSDFVAAVSHEFRTPLTSMRHLTELLASGQIRAEERRHEYYGVLSRETERLHRLVESLLDFGRMEAGRHEYHFQPADAVTLVGEVVEEFRHGINGRAVEYVHTGDSAGALVNADGTALGRAIWNLLDNAAKYAPPDTPIRVETRGDGRHVVIRVRDQGPGIPAAEQAAIFQRFVRGTAARAGHVMGTGLGLAMVQHIVTAHGGAITVESAPGGGSAFTIALPAAGEGAAA